MIHIRETVFSFRRRAARSLLDDALLSPDFQHDRYRLEPEPEPHKESMRCRRRRPHSYMVTLKPPLASGSARRSAPMSDGLHANKGDLSFLLGWFQQYEEDASNGTSRRKLEAGSNATRAVHYFTQTQLAVAIEASGQVHSGPARTNPPTNPNLSQQRAHV